MGLREWLIILGSLILLLIIADGIRRMRKVDQNEQMDEDELARQEQIRRELPSGSARVVKSHDVEVFDDDPIPVLRHEVEIPSAEHPPASSLSSHASEALAQSLQSEEFPLDDEQYSDFPEVGGEPTFAEVEQDETIYQSRTFQPESEESDAVYLQESEFDSAVDPELHLSEDQMMAELSAQDESSDLAESHDSAAYSEPLEALLGPEEHIEPEEDRLHITEFETVDSSMDDLEPLEPLEQRFAAAKARRLEEEERHARQKQAEAEAEAQALEELDPVKAAARRIQGKHTGPRPSERIKVQKTDDEMSLAERQYIQQQEAAKKAQALKLNEAQRTAQEFSQEEQLKQEQGKAEQSTPQAEQDPLFQKKRTTFKERSVTRKPLMTADEERDQISGADELLVMHVKCKDERGFHGAALLHVVMQCGMQFGDMQMFHRFAKTEDGPQIQFSMLSSVEPGVFDIDEIDELYIPSVSFVMGLPAPGSSQECFTMMLETAKVIVRHLNGELRDENRSVMTPQTIEHYKQRIQEFERRKQLARMR